MNNKFKESVLELLYTILYNIDNDGDAILWYINKIDKIENLDEESLIEFLKIKK